MWCRCTTIQHLASGKVLLIVMHSLSEIWDGILANNDSYGKPTGSYWLFITMAGDAHVHHHVKLCRKHTSVKAVMPPIRVEMFVCSLVILVMYRFKYCHTLPRNHFVRFLKWQRIKSVHLSSRDEIAIDDAYRASSGHHWIHYPSSMYLINDWRRSVIMTRIIKCTTFLDKTFI